MIINDEIKTLTRELVKKREKFNIQSTTAKLKKYYNSFYEFFQKKSEALAGYGNPIKISILITNGRNEENLFWLVFTPYEKETMISGYWDYTSKDTKVECFYVFNPDFQHAITTKNKIYFSALDFVLLQVLSKRDEVFSKFEYQILADLKNEIMAHDYLISLTELE